MITPARINDISNEIATIYAHISDELLVNIGKHITSPNWTHTASWEIQKLAELGQLTAENAAIINKWIKAIPPELRNAMEETRKAALDEIEKQMDAAAKQGYVTPPVTDSTVEIFRDMQNQAADRLNLVNTTMLQSSVDQYQRAIVLTQQEYDKLMAQQEATQRALNEGAGSVASGVETRRVAVRRAIGRISAEGLTGFIDRAGRHWTPEAYVNMDVRTTVHNTAIQATRARMNDFGTQVFQVSSHAGARPLCYPYQGKFYSWDNSEGDIELGDGSVVHYEPYNRTSCDQPAGLFQINCQHYPIPIIAGITIPHGADNIQPEEENDKAYALSQEQRALERKIREAKRLVEMAGDTATPEDKQKVKDAQAQMREFIAKTGRTRRYDREQIGGTPPTKVTEAPKAEAPLTTPRQDGIIGEKPTESGDISMNTIDAIRKYTDGDYTNICRYSQYIATGDVSRFWAGDDSTSLQVRSDMLKKITPEEAEAAKEIISAIDRSTVSATPLYRIERADPSGIENGDILTMGIRSTSRIDIFDAATRGEVEGLETYSRHNDGKFIEYIFLSQKSLDVSAWSAYPAQEESLVFGAYRVVKTETVEPIQKGWVKKTLPYTEAFPNYSEFTSKKGNPMIRYYENGVEKTMARSKFMSETYTEEEWNDVPTFGRKRVFLEIDTEGN